MTQPCPRQTHEAVLEVQKRHVSHWEEDGTCSYCGSISPEKLFEAIVCGCKIGPTDKNYKIYVDLVEPNPQELRVISSKNFTDGNEEQQGYIHPKEAIGKVPEKDLKYYLDHYDGNNDWIQLAPRGPTKFGKFYFQHFTNDDQLKFIDLYNQKKINIGYPGHFYVLPFFMVLRSKKED